MDFRALFWKNVKTLILLECCLTNGPVMIRMIHLTTMRFGSAILGSSFEECKLVSCPCAKLEHRRDRVDLFRSLIPQYKYCQTTTGKVIKGALAC